MILFFSHSGNTRACAMQIHEQVGGDLVELRTVDPYPDEYDAVVKRGRQELLSGNLPALEMAVGTLPPQEIVYLGSPNWFSTIAPPVRAFLSGSDLSGRTIIPFITHGGGGMARCVDDIRKLCPDSTVLDGIAIPDGDGEASRSQMSVWLRTLGR